MNEPAGSPGPDRWRVQVDGGACFEVSADEDALLRGAVRAGTGWPYECSVGGCGACRYELLDGEVEDLWPQAPGLSARDRARGKRLACQTRVKGDLRVRVRTDDALRPVIAPRRLEARLESSRALTGDLREFSFRTAGPANFLPGQYALLHLPGVAGARAYSMSNLANDDGTWQFVVRRVPEGRGSRFMFDRLEVGQGIELDGPYGHAWLRPTGRDVVCIAGGSGLGPMLSIARGVLAGDDQRRAQFFIGMRSQADLGGLDALADLDTTRIAVRTVLSEPRALPRWEGPSGFVHEEAERRIGHAHDHFDYYFAGPPAMVDAVQQLLMVRKQVPFDRIHFDRFV